MNTPPYNNCANSNRKNLTLAGSLKQKILKTLALLSLVVILAACAAFSGRESVGEYVDDAGITTSVKNEIFQDPKLKLFQIHVETFKNQVQLSGFVDSHNDAMRAEQIARNVSGVKEVRNNIIVRKKAPKMRRSR
jgi:hyperosmotically inducible periplasmic protein